VYNDLCGNTCSIGVYKKISIQFKCNVELGEGTSITDVEITNRPIEVVMIVD
jgi:hypothetical protein